MATLFLVATPIGNLGDISPRAIDTLRKVDLIACEDTRQSLKLLSHYGIQKPLTSYHDFNEREKAVELAGRIENGENIALVSDAGTPAISDPGFRLVRLCRERGIPVVSIPGANAAITALSASGLPSDQFLFVGQLFAERWVGTPGVRCNFRDWDRCGQRHEAGPDERRSYHGQF